MSFFPPSYFFFIFSPKKKAETTKQSRGRKNLMTLVPSSAAAPREARAGAPGNGDVSGYTHAHTAQWFKPTSQYSHDANSAQTLATTWLVVQTALLSKPTQLTGVSCWGLSGWQQSSQACQDMKVPPILESMAALKTFSIRSPNNGEVLMWTTAKTEALLKTPIGRVLSTTFALCSLTVAKEYLTFLRQKEWGLSRHFTMDSNINQT